MAVNEKSTRQADKLRSLQEGPASSAAIFPFELSLYNAPSVSWRKIFVPHRQVRPALTDRREDAEHAVASANDSGFAVVLIAITLATPASERTAQACDIALIASTLQSSHQLYSASRNDAPMLTHEEARSAVLTVVNTISKSPRLGELELVSALEAEGFSHLHAEKLCIFVPSAFASALLKRMGLQSFPSHYVALNRFGAEVELPIAREHYFTAALQLGFEALERGWTPDLTKEKFTTVLLRSAEYGALNKLLDSGKSVADARLLPLRVFRISAELANEDMIKSPIV